MKSEILHGDSLKLLKNLPANSFDLCITDPPYGISRKNQLHTMNRGGINFGNWDTNFDHSSWLNIVFPLMKPGASIIIWMDWKKLTYYYKKLENLGFEVKRLLTWIKTNPFPRNKDRTFLQSLFGINLISTSGNCP